MDPLSHGFEPMPPKAETRLFWPLAALLLGAISGIAYLSGENPLAEGPQLQNARVTQSIWHEHTLAVAWYREAADELIELSKSGGGYIQDAFSVGADGRLLPKHTLLTAILALPFYAVFGLAGFWIFNQVMLLSALGAMRSLVRRALGCDMRLALLLVVFGLTQTGAYVFGFHYDIAALAFVLIGFALYPSAPFWGTAILMLAVHVRLTSLLLVPFLFLVGPMSPRHLLRAAMGGGIVLGLLLLCNAWLWGHPLRTAYHSLPMFEGGRMIPEPHPLGISFEVLSADWYDKLFGRNVGLLRWNPLLALVPFGWWLCLRHPARRFFLWTGLAAIVQILCVFAYPAWNASHLGNRFLFPAIFLVLPPALLLILKAQQRLARPRAETHVTSARPCESQASSSNAG